MICDDVPNNVINLIKDYQISDSEERLLGRGLTFVPSFEVHRQNRESFLEDLKKYHRRIKLAYYFKDLKQQPPPLFQQPSSWEPPIWTLPCKIRELIKKDNDDVNHIFRKFHEIHNLSRDEIVALKRLKKDTRIIIKKADKGSAVVLMGREDYIWEAERQLKNRTYYRELKQPIYLKTRPIIFRVVQKLLQSGLITRRQAEFLRGEEEPRLRRFYILPKIHKDPETWSVPHQIPPGRPIVSDCGSETNATAQFVEHYLHPVSILHPSYVKDTTHFINLIKNLKIPINSFLFTIDVDSLYTNIDINSGLKAVKNIFQKHPDKNRPDKEILTLLHINLIKNDFTFNGRYYLQIKGTAMGKRFAPSYANIFMAQWEGEALATCARLPLIFLRYLDDIFGVWQHSEEEFQDFFQHLDSHDPSIRLKSTIHRSQVDFLDTTVFKGKQFEQSRILDIKVYFKETNTHALLHKQSFHPKHTFRGLVTSQILRFRRISTRDLDFHQSTRVLFRVLRRRGYGRSFLRKCYKQGIKKYAMEKQKEEKQRQNQMRQSLIGSTTQNTNTHTQQHTHTLTLQKTTTKLIPLISKYSTLRMNLHRKIKMNFKHFLTNTKFGDSHKIISAYERNKNLTDYLIRAELKP